MDKEKCSVATLVGCIIGAGVLGIPYVVAKAGFLTGILDIVLIGLAILVVNLYLGEVVLRTKETHQLTGYAEKYLGRVGKELMSFSMIVGVYGALIAYLIGIGVSMNAIFSGDALLWSLLFFVFFSLAIYFGIRSIGKCEFFMCSFIVLVILLICFIGFFKINVGNLTGFDLSKVFVPYGVILFAFLGSVAIPEMNEILGKDKKCFKRDVVIGTLIPFFLYLFFALVVVGVSGVNTSEVATVGLGKVLGKGVVLFGNLFAIFAMGTSFLALGFGLKEMYYYDYKIDKNIAWFLACFIPLVLFLGGVRSFVNTINYAGVVTGGVTGILIVLMGWRARLKGERKPEYEVVRGKFLGYILIGMFILGIIYQFL